MLKKYEDQISLLEERIKGFQDRITELKTIKDKVAAASEKATDAQKELAVALHELLCTKDHGMSQEQCSWELADDCNDATKCDWTEKAHLNWLLTTQNGIAKMKELGFKVTEPK